MRKFFIPALCLLFLFSCKKDKKTLPEPHPSMQYTDLGNAAVRFNEFKKINIDGDNTFDFLFSTLLVGDPIGRRDRQQYYVSSSFDAFLPVSGEEQLLMLNKDDAITIANRNGYNWFNASSVVLAEKIIEENGSEHWEGKWKNASHKYVPVQVNREGQLYNGWVEISFNIIPGEIILHRAAIAREAGKDIRAGL